MIFSWKQALGVACLSLSLQDDAFAEILDISTARTQDLIACGLKGGALMPVGKTHRPPPYLAESMKSGERATVLLKVDIRQDGIPAKAAVLTTSGSAGLDEVAGRWILGKWRWQPWSGPCPAIATKIGVQWDLHNAQPVDIDDIRQMLCGSQPSPGELHEHPAAVCPMLPGQTSSFVPAVTPVIRAPHDGDAASRLQFDR